MYRFTAINLTIIQEDNNLTPEGILNATQAAFNVLITALITYSKLPYLGRRILLDDSANPGTPPRATALTRIGL
jgi:hypothetical protein